MYLYLALRMSVAYCICVDCCCLCWVASRRSPQLVDKQEYNVLGKCLVELFAAGRQICKRCRKPPKIFAKSQALVQPEICDHLWLQMDPCSDAYQDHDIRWHALCIARIVGGVVDPAVVAYPIVVSPSQVAADVIQGPKGRINAGEVSGADGIRLHTPAGGPKSVSTSGPNEWCLLVEGVVQVITRTRHGNVTVWASLRGAAMAVTHQRAMLACDNRLKLFSQQCGSLRPYHVRRNTQHLICTGVVQRQPLTSRTTYRECSCCTIRRYWNHDWRQARHTSPCCL
jgi:hypothetical protein